MAFQVALTAESFGALWAEELQPLSTGDRIGEVVEAYQTAIGLPLGLHG